MVESASLPYLPLCELVRSEMLTRVSLGVAFAAIAAIQPPLAHADPGDDFLAATHAYGIDLTALLGVSPQDAVGLGQAICDDLRFGEVSGDRSPRAVHETAEDHRQAVRESGVSRSVHTCRDTLS